VKAISKFFNAVHIFIGYVAIVQLLAMILIVSAQVFSRFITGSSIKWSDEVSLILMVWFSFIGLAIGVRQGLHISIELFTMKLSDKVKKNFIERLTHICTLIIGIILVYFGIKLAENGMMSTLPATGLPSAVEYLFVPVCGILVTYDSILGLLGIDTKEGGLEEILIVKEK
jgi:TRAP-type C4-dicarboxylate transport system permease small subunit